MNGNELGKPYPIRLTYDQNRAIDMLKLSSFNKTKFIRAAINEKLHRDFRSMLKKIQNNKLPF
jgi:hypothetical protein